MAGGFFDHLESNLRKKPTKRKLTLPVSIALHVVVLFAVIVVPLLTWTDLPDPAEGAVRAFFVEPATTPPPPPPPPAAAAPKPALPKPRIEPAKVAPAEVPKFLAPVEVPKEIAADPTVGSEDIGLGDVSAGVPGGVVGGVPGGVEGGVVGGVVGGVLGGVPEPAATPPPTPEPEVPKGPVRVGGKISEPRKIKNVPPVYPDVARQARVSGIVVLECTISPQGRVTNVRVMRGIPLLNDAALSAVRSWVYTPTLLNGVPVPVIMTVTVNFRLGD